MRGSPEETRVWVVILWVKRSPVGFAQTVTRRGCHRPAPFCPVLTAQLIWFRTSAWRGDTALRFACRATHSHPGLPAPSPVWTRGLTSEGLVCLPDFPHTNFHPNGDVCISSL